MSGTRKSRIAKVPCLEKGRGHRKQLVTSRIWNAGFRPMVQPPRKGRALLEAGGGGHVGAAPHVVNAGRAPLSGRSPREIIVDQSSPYCFAILSFDNMPNRIY